MPNPVAHIASTWQETAEVAWVCPARAAVKMSDKHLMAMKWPLALELNELEGLRG